MRPFPWRAEFTKALREAVNSSDKKWKRTLEQHSTANAAIADQVKALAEHFRAYKEQQNTDDRKERRLNIITIFLVSLTVIFTGGSWWDFNGQLDEMRKASDQAEKATISSGRAWVGVAGSKINGTVAANTEVKIVTSTRNTGREPAMNFTWDLSPVVITDDDDVFEKQVTSYVGTCFQRPSKKGSQVLYPSSGFGTGFDFTIVVPKEQVDDDVVAGRRTIVALGCLVYDTFDKTRHSTFCYFYKNGLTPADNLNICSGGTYAD